VKRPFYSSRKADVSSLKECIDELLNSYKLKGKLDQTHVMASWEKVMGSPIASRTVSLSFQEKKLFVKLNSAPLKQELSMSKSKIIKLLNENVGANLIDEIIFL
jgi:predicted nucleic acid-binding Zn ribbon protein